MHLEKLFNSEVGKIFVSIILGLGLATLFRTACSGYKCYNFVGPQIQDVKTKTYKFNDKCYSYEEHAVSCDTSKKHVRFSS